jgi:hypothetical protein
VAFATTSGVVRTVRRSPGSGIRGTGAVGDSFTVSTTKETTADQGE